jgi:hypothetical protein
LAIICPFANWRPLPEAVNQPIITPRVCIYHTMVGSLAGTERHFRESTGLESHFGVGGPTDGAALDGVLWQWMDLGREADANLDANSFAISIETSDGGDPSRPWSTKQLATLVRLGNWLANRFSIPRRQCPAWNQAGFGWHVMFGAPSHWTPVAKTCPGPVRIRQLRETVFPAIFAGRQLEGDLSMTDAQDIRNDIAKLSDDIVGYERRAADGNADTPGLAPSRKELLDATKALAMVAPQVDAAAVAAALAADAGFLAAIATAVADEQARRQAE